MKTALFEPFSGIAGDMTVAAFLDLGMPLKSLREALGGMPLEGYRIRAEKAKRGAFTGTRFFVDIEETHPHRGLAEVAAIIRGGALPELVVSRALTAFTLLAEAEGRAHDRPTDEVHFHEVGAVDAIVDIVGAAFGLWHFGVERVLTTAVRAGTGEVECRHGRIPVPAPATSRLLRGLPVRLAEGEGETVTPTGAALLAAWAEPLGGARVLVPGAVGYGAGTREDTALPNLLRVTLCEEAGDPSEEVVELRANLDDQSPEEVAFAVERLLGAGALDAWVVPATMKKGRSGHVLSVLARPWDGDRLAEEMLRETTTFGVRRSVWTRDVLEREWVEVETPWGTVRMKLGKRSGEVRQAAPEFEDCARLARESGVPLRRVTGAAREAFERLAEGE